jgi:hypothetical protein
MNRSINGDIGSGTVNRRRSGINRRNSVAEHLCLLNKSMVWVIYCHIEYKGNGTDACVYAKTYEFGCDRYSTITN